MEREAGSPPQAVTEIQNQLISLSEALARTKASLGTEGIDMLNQLKQLSRDFSDISRQASAYYLERLLAPCSTRNHEIFQAIRQLSARKKGALIVIQREDPLEERMTPGTPLFAEISSSLLVSIFNVGSPLHDGAVLIQGNTIVSAANILPLTRRAYKKQKMGTRHRAAIGLSELTDALIFVVSEETGKESFAYRGALYPFQIAEES